MTDTVKPMIQAENLSKHFSGLHALNKASLSVNKGEVVCLIGPSGSGKSTFLRCIHGLETPDEGRVLVEGEVMDPSDKEEYRRLRNKMGFVFQHFNLFPNMTVLENCKLAQMNVLKRSEQDAEKVALEYLGKVGLTEKKDAYPNKLSGGQKQRVSIAGVIAMHPKCIILDEPTAMLDPNGRKEVVRAVRALNDVEGITIVLITHYMEEIIHADMVFVMDKGHIAMEGTPREIFSRVEELKELRLDVPQVTLLAYELKQSGMDLPDGILTIEELTEALAAKYEVM